MAEPSAAAASSYPAGKDKVAGFELSYGMTNVANKSVLDARRTKMTCRSFIKCGAMPNSDSAAVRARARAQLFSLWPW